MSGSYTAEVTPWPSAGGTKLTLRIRAACIALCVLIGIALCAYRHCPLHLQAVFCIYRHCPLHFVSMTCCQTSTVLIPGMDVDLRNIKSTPTRKGKNTRHQPRYQHSACTDHHCCYYCDCQAAWISRMDHLILVIHMD